MDESSFQDRCGSLLRDIVLGDLISCFVKRWCNLSSGCAKRNCWLNDHEESEENVFGVVNLYFSQAKYVPREILESPIIN